MKKLLWLMVASLAVLAGCSKAESIPPVSEGWKEEIDLYLDSPDLTDKQREILADYWVSDEELIEIHDDWIQCMADGGFENAKLGGPDLMSPGYDTGGSEVLWAEVQAGQITEEEYLAKLDEVSDHCEATTWRNISMYYIGMRENPDYIDPMPEILNCLKEAEFIFADATLDDLYEMLSGDGPYNPTSEEQYCFGAGVEWTPEGLAAALNAGE